MTKPQPGSADDGSVETEKEPAAVRRETDTAADHDDALAQTTEVLTDTGNAADVKAGRRITWSRVLVYAMLPGLALVLAIVAGLLKWQDSSAHSSQIARIESVAAARDATIAVLSYQPDTADKDLAAARDRLTGTFKESYTQLTHDVVIPGARQKHISSVAKVPAAASVSATGNHAVALLYVNQTTIVGTDAPTDTVSGVRVTLDKINGRWLISAFDPI